MQAEYLSYITATRYYRSNSPDITTMPHLYGAPSRPCGTLGPDCISSNLRTESSPRPCQLLPRPCEVFQSPKAPQSLRQFYLDDDLVFAYGIDSDDTLEASNSAIEPAPRLEVMGIAAGGKLIQDLVADFRPRHTWNTSRTRLTNIHIFSPASFEAVTHIVPHDVPITAKDYVDAGLPFFVVEEDTENRIDGSETLDAVKSVSEMDKQIGVDTTGASSADTKVPKQCGICKVRLCDCM